MPSYVPKVHPATRAVEPDDPMFLQATPIVGDPEVMLRCLVQEYAQMGWNTEQIFGLFRDSGYPVLNDLLRIYGEHGVREHVAGVLQQTGIFCCVSTVAEEPESGESEPELIQLGVGMPPFEGWKEVGYAEGI